MRFEKINNNLTIDLDAVNNNGYCPHCGGEHFEIKVETARKNTEKLKDNGVYVNKCIDCKKVSIHKEGKQYKKA